MIFVGVDTGKNGAIAAVTESGDLLANIVHFSDATTEGRIGLLVADYLHALVESQHGDSSAVVVTVERVGAMPKQGLSSTFVFGRVYGEALTGVLCSAVRMSLVAPAVWQRDLQLPKSEDKIARKRLLRDAASTHFGRKFTLAECDAAWLAEHGRRFGPWRVPRDSGED